MLLLILINHISGSSKLFDFTLLHLESWCCNLHRKFLYSRHSMILWGFSLPCLQACIKPWHFWCLAWPSSRITVHFMALKKYSTLFLYQSVVVESDSSHWLLILYYRWILTVTECFYHTTASDQITYFRMINSYSEQNGNSL